MGEDKMIKPYKNGITKKLLLDLIKEFDVGYVDTNLIWLQFLEDVEYVSQKDSSQTSVQDVLKNASRSIFATLIYRLSHQVSFVDINCARRISEYGANLTSIDIHPQAQIGKGLFIDHGANVVIGQTCVIGDYCNIFQNVILGAKNVQNNETTKRHPTIGDNVTICGGCRVLGNINIGNNVFISPNCVVLDDVPDNTKVTIVNQLQFEDNIVKNVLPRQKLEIYGIVPKWRNTLIIEGSGIYNPTVLIKCDAHIDYVIDYWDKNKIIIKIKDSNIEMSQLKKNKIIILSNSDKVIVINCFALTKVII